MIEDSRVKLHSRDCFPFESVTHFIFDRLEGQTASRMSCSTTPHTNGSHMNGPNKAENKAIPNT